MKPYTVKVFLYDELHPYIHSGYRTLLVWKGYLWVYVKEVNGIRSQRRKISRAKWDLIEGASPSPAPAQPAPSA